jgi:hypothetical protein
MANQAEFPAIFDRLRDLLKPYEAQMDATANTADSYSLDTRNPGPNKKPMFFGSTAIKKNYVSYYLMPVYVHPELLEGVSERLRKRMQGKSCFNFRSVDEEALAELRELTARGYAACLQDGRI